MDDPKIALPPWLPWATIACLAALAACAGELWLVERTRLGLAREESLLAKAALKGADNQLEAERILSAREIRHAREASTAAGGFRIAALESPGGESDGGSGIVLWAVSDPRAVDARFQGLSAPGPGRVYRLWLVAPAPLAPEDCGTLSGAPQGPVQIRLGAPIAAGSRFVLVSEPSGTPPGRVPGPGSGSIVLASLPIEGSISGR